MDLKELDWCKRGLDYREYRGGFLVLHGEGLRISRELEISPSVVSLGKIVAKQQAITKQSPPP